MKNIPLFFSQKLLRKSGIFKIISFAVILLSQLSLWITKFIISFASQIFTLIDESDVMQNNLGGFKGKFGVKWSIK